MRTAIRVAFFMILLGIASACSAGADTPTPTQPEAEAVYTAAAMTAFARLTEQAAAPTETATPTPPPPTNTPGPSNTPPASVTPTSFHSGGQDIATFVQDVTIPDGTTVQVGESFVKTWRLQNAGTSTWNTGYSVVFFGGVQMNAPDEVSLEEEVVPGGTIDVSVPMSAPDGLGLQRGDWMLKNSLGQRFGIGETGNDAFYVLVNVVSSGEQSSETRTPPPPGSDPVTAVEISLSETSFTGACPHNFTVTVKVTAGQQGGVTLGLEAGSDDPSYVFNLPGPTTYVMQIGENSYIYNLALDGSVNGWVRAVISSPVQLFSDQASFSLTCE